MNKFINVYKHEKLFTHDVDDILLSEIINKNI